MTRPDDTEPSAEACKAAAAVLPITWGKQLVHDVALALNRFRAAGVREERERTQGAINTVRDSNIIKGRRYSACWMNACTEIESILSAPESSP